MKFIIKPAMIKQWGWEIVARGFHNIAPTKESAINYLKDRYGHDVKYTIKEKA